MEVMIRKSCADDITRLGELASSGFASKTRFCFGKDLRKTAMIFSDFFSTGFFPLEHTLVATDGKTVIAFSTVKLEDKRPSFFTFSRIFIKRLGLLWGIRALAILPWLLDQPFDPKTQVFWEMLAVDERYRSQGIGTTIIKETFMYSATTGRRELCGYVVTNNRARELYLRLGGKLDPPQFKLPWLANILYGFRGYQRLLVPLASVAYDNKTGTDA